MYILLLWTPVDVVIFVRKSHGEDVLLAAEPSLPMLPSTTSLIYQVAAYQVILYIDDVKCASYQPTWQDIIYDESVNSSAVVQELL